MYLSIGDEVELFRSVGEGRQARWSPDRFCQLRFGRPVVSGEVRDRVEEKERVGRGKEGGEGFKLLV